MTASRPLSARPRAFARLAVALALTAPFAAPAHAQILDCTLNGEWVSPSNGSTTRGKTGIMRCVDRETKVIARESELRDGATIGVQRWYEAGVLRREYSVNERGNRDGRSREWTAKGVLVDESLYANAESVGLHRRWYDDGTPASVAHWGDGGGERRSEAFSRYEYDRDGRLSGLRCGPVPRLDDEARLCGHEGGARTTELFARGRVAARVTHLKGELQQRETLRADGSLETVETRDGATITFRALAADGTLRRETVGVGRLKVREATFTERGTPLREQRWSDGLPERDAEWYLNGRMRRERTYERVTEDTKDGTRSRITAYVERGFHDDGTLAAEGRYAAAVGGGGGGSRMVPVGPHRAYDAQGRVLRESVYDERGRLTREREWDAQGTVLRDDAVYEDGSRRRP